MKESRENTKIMIEHYIEEIKKDTRNDYNHKYIENVYAMIGDGL